MPDTHLITSEFPPDLGGVSDYTCQIARELGAAGDTVHVWCPACDRPVLSDPGVMVHRDFDRFDIHGLRRLDQELNRFPSKRRLLVQWIPHGYGFRAMNIAFCLWLWKRARIDGDHVELMVHEAFLAFHEGSWRQDAVAVVHRLMTVILLQAANWVWVSIPAWERAWRPYMLWRRVPFQWLPIPSNVPLLQDSDEAKAVRARYPSRILIGHFGTYPIAIRDLLKAIAPRLLDNAPERQILLIGKGSERFCEELRRANPHLKDRVHATGSLGMRELSGALGACDVLIQPYPDGVSTRRTSLMAALEHGIPTVSTTGHLSEPFWQTVEGVALAPVGDTEEFVRLAQLLLENEAERKRIGSAARALYKAKFDVRHIVATLRAAA